MQSFSHYLLLLINGFKRWHVLVLTVLLVHIAVAAWFLHQQYKQDAKHVQQLFELNEQSALMASQAVAISHLELNEFKNLAASIEGYQTKLDRLSPAYQQGANLSWQTFKQLSDIWQPIRDAGAGLLESDDALTRLREAVEDTDQHLPEVIAEHDRVIDALRIALQKPASLKLLREQRLILHRMAANTNAATASVLSAVDANARAVLSGSIEADLFLLEKSLEIMVSSNKEALQQAEQEGTDVSLLLKIDAIADRLTEVSESIRKVLASLSVMRDINKHAQLLVEDGGLLIQPTQQLILDKLHSGRVFSMQQLWLYLSIALVLFWLFYIAYFQARQLDAEQSAILSEKEDLKAGVSSIAKQMASFSEGDHAIVARSEAIDCQHLVEQANRMMAYVNSIDKQIEKDFLPLIKRLAMTEAEIVTTIDRQANDIARLSSELNNVVAGQTSGSTELAGQLVHTQSQLQSLLQQIDQAKQQLPQDNDSISAEKTLHAVRQLQQHIEDRLHTLTELSQRINLEVIDVSASLAGRSGSDRVLRRAIEQVQSLTGRYQGQVNDVAQLLDDMTSSMGSLLQQMEQVQGISKTFEDFQLSTVANVSKIDQNMSEFAGAIASADRAQARHTEAISLILDELQDGNQRLSVSVVDSDVGIKNLDRLAAAQINTSKAHDTEDAHGQRAES